MAISSCEVRDYAKSQKKEEMEKIAFACLPDAQSVAERFEAGRFDHSAGGIREVPVYAKGSSKADGSCRIVKSAYRFKLRVELRQEDLVRARPVTRSSKTIAFLLCADSRLLR